MAMDKVCLDNLQEQYLQERWHQLIPLSNPLSKHYFDQLIAAYSEEHRYYHTPEHLYHLIGLLREVSVADPAVYWASFYHDYVYIAGRQNNEAKSADIAKEQMLELNIDLKVIDRCCDLILLTKTHQLNECDPDAAAFLDADMAILGVEEKAYADYVERVQKEYSSIPGFLFNRGRRKFIETCLNQNRLFNTNCFFDRFETQARKNLAWELSIK
jgi:predicted metal-dependent HD superfamily phosphohydrolase